MPYWDYTRQQRANKTTFIYVSMRGRQVAASFQIKFAHPFRYTVATNNRIILKCSAIADDCRVHSAKELTLVNTLKPEIFKQ